MSWSIRHVAKGVRGLTYSETMEIARWFAMACQERTNNDDAFNEEDANEWAQFLNDWAESWMENNPEEER